MTLPEGEPLSAARDQATEIAGGRFDHIAFGAAADYGGGLHFGNAVLSRFPILKQEVLTLPGAESGETRCLLYALLRTPQGEQSVFVTHLNWKLDQSSVRLLQTRFIAERVLELSPPREGSLPPVLMGDFNADPNSDEIRYLSGQATVKGESVYFADVWRYQGGAPGYTFDSKNPYAALAFEPPRRIDYIFVGRGPDEKGRGLPLKPALCFAEPDPAGVWPSDHFGVVADLQVEPR